ncbi:MAG: four helix bundle protein [Candidatus Kuenenia sp.]|nr:four helix bundle protein [Candidatus Kuenenia hertensis]
MKENVIVNKSYAFAVKLVKFCFELQDKKKEFVLSRQLLKSGTSIGANVEEAQGAISKAEFIAKVQIALKEAKETKYWLRLIKDADLFHNDQLEQLLAECNEIIVILTSILKTSKENKK